MQLYGIGDLHLSLGVPEKPMDIFHGWENYMQLLTQPLVPQIPYC